MTTDRRTAAATRLLGWAVVAALGLLAVARVVAWGATVPALLALHGLGPFPYLAAVPVVAAALPRGHLRLALVALAVAAVSLPTGLPEVAARRPVPAAARSSPKLRILSWNLHNTNTDVAAINRVIAEADADVVVLQEVSPANIGSPRSAPALARYEHTFTTPQPSAFGSGIWSRLPLEAAGEFDVGGLPMTRAVVRTAAGPVQLVNVHTLSPATKDGQTLWPRQLAFLAQEARRPGPPVMMAGDFNAAWGHQPFRRLLDAGLADAAAARGSPWSPTWRAGGRVLPPVLRLDHILTGPGLVATSFATGPAGGSDHRSIVATVAIEPERPA